MTKAIMSCYLQHKLPTELIEEIATHLAFFDELAFANTCRKTAQILKPLICYEEITWSYYLAYLSKKPHPAHVHVLPANHRAIHLRSLTRSLNVLNECIDDSENCTIAEMVDDDAEEVVKPKPAMLRRPTREDMEMHRDNLMFLLQPYWEKGAEKSGHRALSGLYLDSIREHALVIASGVFWQDLLKLLDYVADRIRTIEWRGSPSV